MHTYRDSEGSEVNLVRMPNEQPFNGRSRNSGTNIEEDGTSPSPVLLSVRDLVVEYRVSRRATLRAVDGVDLTVRRGETVGVVGESGSGKSTIGRALLGLSPVSAGSIVFNGADITHADPRQRRALSSELQVVFQDPYSSLNPARTVGQTMAETLLIHERLERRTINEQVRSQLEKVGLPSDAAARYPDQFSGGQRQRIAIARALVASPRLVICDEAVSALDLSVQAQVLNLLDDLQAELHLSYLFITHDLGVVRHVSQRIVVLYSGQVMETGLTTVVHDNPVHPYSQMLVRATPLADPVLQRKRRASNLVHTVQSQTASSTSSCPFAQRCPYVIERCRVERPLLETVDNGSKVACHRWREIGDGLRKVDATGSER
jgi:oligopeptide/dipeptide ABC transporter ATP-binding protein